MELFCRWLGILSLLPGQRDGERRRIAARRKLLPNGRCNNYLSNEKGKEKYSLRRRRYVRGCYIVCNRMGHNLSLGLKNPMLDGVIFSVRSLFTEASMVHWHNSDWARLDMLGD